jgi:hypothetical protein
VQPVFISYRRDDSLPWTSRLHDSLAARLGRDQVFIDVSDIDPGADFEEVVAEQVAASAVVLAVIGPRWLAAVDDRGRRRLDDPTDLVRVEIASALAGGVPVVPVLVGGGAMPRSQDLSDDLRELSRRNAVALTDTGWNGDLEPLVRTLRGFLGRTPSRATQSDAVARARNTARRLRNAVAATSELHLEDEVMPTAEQLAAVDPAVRDLVHGLTEARQVPPDGAEKHRWVLPALLEHGETLRDVLGIGRFIGSMDLAAVTSRRILYLSEEPWQSLKCASVRFEPGEEPLLVTEAGVFWGGDACVLAVTTDRVVFIRRLLRGGARGGAVARSEIRHARRAFRHSDVAVNLSTHRRDVTFGGLSGAGAGRVLLALASSDPPPPDALLTADTALEGRREVGPAKKTSLTEDTLWRWEAVLDMPPEEAENTLAATLRDFGGRRGTNGDIWKIGKRWTPRYAELRVYIEPLRPAHSLVVLTTTKERGVPDFGLRESVLTEVSKRLGPTNREESVSAAG